LEGGFLLAWVPAHPRIIHKTYVRGTWQPAMVS
jgi:hypothetical protein